MRIVVVMPDTLLREAFERLLELQGFTSVGSCSDVSDATKLAQQGSVIVAFSDDLGETDISRLRAWKPQAAIRILAVGHSLAATDIAGVPYDRFVPRNASTGRLFRVLNELAPGSMRLAVHERTSAYRSRKELTEREHEIALKVAEGCSNRDIASELGLGEQTVKNMVSVILRKLDCDSRVQVALRLARGKETEG